MKDVVIDRKDVIVFRGHLGDVFLKCPHCSAEISLVVYDVPSSRGARCFSCGKTFNLVIK